MNALEALLPKTRREILALTLLHPRESFHLRDLARRLSTGHGILQREVAQLVAAGILTARRESGKVLYQADTTSLIFGDLRELFNKTVGPVGQLRRVLLPLEDSIKFAFIYGSVAAGVAKDSSDVDLLVVGEVTFAQVSDALPPAEIILQREVNPTVYSLKDFKGKRKGPRGFLAGVLSGPVDIVMGDENVLEELE